MVVYRERISKKANTAKMLATSCRPFPFTLRHLRGQGRGYSDKIELVRAVVNGHLLALPAVHAV